MSASRLLIYDGELREDEHSELGVFLCEECETLNAGYGPCAVRRLPLLSRVSEESAPGAHLRALG